MTAAAPTLRVCSRSAFVAIAGKDDGLLDDVPDFAENGLVRRDTTFKFTYASRSCDIRPSWLGGLILLTAVTYQVTTCLLVHVVDAAH